MEGCGCNVVALNTVRIDQQVRTSTAAHGSLSAAKMVDVTPLASCLPYHGGRLTGFALDPTSAVQPTHWDGNKRNSSPSLLLGILLGTVQFFPHRVIVDIKLHSCDPSFGLQASRRRLTRLNSVN